MRKFICFLSHLMITVVMLARNQPEKHKLQSPIL